MGLTDGLSVGVLLGEELGLRNGLAEDEALGEELGIYRDGLLEGVALGEELGLTDGLAEREELGEELGLVDGLVEGKALKEEIIWSYAPPFVTGTRTIIVPALSPLFRGLLLVLLHCPSSCPARPVSVQINHPVWLG